MPRKIGAPYLCYQIWLGMRDSNPRSWDQNPVPYRLANPQCTAEIIAEISLFFLRIDLMYRWIEGWKVAELILNGSVVCGHDNYLWMLRF